MFSRVRIKQNEVGLWFRHGDFKKFLEPGVYFVPGRIFGFDEVEVFDTLNARFEHPLLDVLVVDEDLKAELFVVDLVDDERAFVWKDGRLFDILGPGRHAFWKRPYDLDFEVKTIADPLFEHDRMNAILLHAKASYFLQPVHVETGERVLFFQEGRLIGTVDEGMTVFWKQVAGVTWKIVDQREQVADVAGQEIMTSDKVTLRVNLVATYQVKDAVKAVATVDDYEQALYREAQLALRKIVGTRALDALLTDKEAVGTEVAAAIAKRATEFGVAVISVGLRDIILPGDMKTILNQVIEAEKQAEANLIRRREETAAARSQANTARLLAANPALARMKELEAVQDILAGAKATFVFGKTDLVGQVRQLTETNGEED